MGRNNSKSSNRSSGHSGDTRPGQTRKKTKDLSTRDREDGGRGEGGVCMLCVSNSEERDRGVGAGVNSVKLSETL